MRRLVKTLLTLAAVAVAALPAALVYGLGVHRSGVLPEPLGPNSGALFFLTLFYVLWLPATVYGLIWLFDRLGYHYALGERRAREQKPPRRVRRRRAAGLRYLEGRERARQAAEREARARVRDAEGPDSQAGDAAVGREHIGREDAGHLPRGSGEG